MHRLRWVGVPPEKAQKWAHQTPKDTIPPWAAGALRLHRQERIGDDRAGRAVRRLRRARRPRRHTAKADASSPGNTGGVNVVVVHQLQRARVYKVSQHRTVQAIAAGRPWAETIPQPAAGVAPAPRAARSEGRSRNTPAPDEGLGFSNPRPPRLTKPVASEVRDLVHLEVSSVRPEKMDQILHHFAHTFLAALVLPR